ncbi:MAG: peptidase [Thermoanaerobaculia bacterium]|nr:peptidase [Thermoanaerobaculia bacterium]
MRSTTLTLLLAFAVCLTAVPAGAARFVIENKDVGTGKGFDDPTPAAPVGGNNGTTLGEQRLNVFRYAAEIWGRALESPVEIVVSASFSPITDDPCTATTGILGAAGPVRALGNFDGSPRQNVLYPVALANKFAGVDLRPTEADINARFNSLVDDQTCLGTRDWYYGLDTNHGEDIDLAVVLLHEFGHGLGVSGSMNLSTGRLFNTTTNVPIPNIFEINALDLTTGLRWDLMTDAQRKVAVTNSGNAVWIGEATRTAAPQFLGSTSVLAINPAGAAARVIDVNTAAFGPLPSASPAAGRIVAATDAANPDGPTTTDGCSPFNNAVDVAGQIALVDRGTCFFVDKARNAQNAGAIAVVVANQEPCGLPPMGGDDTNIRIPAVGISRADGETIRTQLATGVDGNLRVDPSSRAGASSGGFVRLYAPCTLEQGSSVFHWDITATPNVLMEPAINGDLRHVLDLTLYQMLDIGWTTSTQPLAPPSGRRTLRRGR